MKVIIVKKCKNGDVNDVVEVSDGYAKNFLIKKNFALPYNETNKKQLQKHLNKIEETNKKATSLANTQKEELEKIELVFSLTVRNNIVHNSVTNKQILKQLKEKGFNFISKYNLEHNLISSIGITKIKVKLDKGIIAFIKVRIGKNGETT